MTKTITPRKLYDRITSGDRVNLLDLRNREEFEAWHITADNVVTHRIAGSEAIAASVTGSLVTDIEASPLEQPVVVVCPRGKQSAEIADTLVDTGFDAMNLEGGMRAWARLLVDRPIDTDGTVIQFERPSSGCLSYLIVDGSEAAVIDPLRAFTDRYLDAAQRRGVAIEWVVDTHVHADHVSGIRSLADRTEATPVLPRAATDRGLTFDATFLDDGDRLEVGDNALIAESAPGHTGESMVFTWQSILFTGDTLFLDGVGRPDLEEGTDRANQLAELLYDTLHERLLGKPPQLLIAPGHTTTLTDGSPTDAVTAPLRVVTERLRLTDRDRDAFVDHLTNTVPARPANYQRIAAVNLGQETVDDDAAFELELGPNNCAIVTPTQN